MEPEPPSLTFSMPTLLSARTLHEPRRSITKTLSAMMKELEKQKRDAEAILYDIAEEDEERQEVEAEIVTFEQWVEKVQPLLTDKNYTLSYEGRKAFSSSHPESESDYLP
jgi:septal ring factor EnvC (AmiA/AmiB activator)